MPHKFFRNWGMGPQEASAITESLSKCCKSENIEVYSIILLAFVNIFEGLFMC